MGAGCTRRSCTAWTTPACSTSPEPSWIPPTSGPKGGELTGPGPVDRRKPGSKTHVLPDANGLPMVTGHQTRHDAQRDRHFKPKRRHADKAYDIPDLRKRLQGKRIGVRIARKSIESSERLGRLGTESRAVLSRWAASPTATA